MRRPFKQTRKFLAIQQPFNTLSFAKSSKIVLLRPVFRRENEETHEDDKDSSGHGPVRHNGESPRTHFANRPPRVSFVRGSLKDSSRGAPHFVNCEEIFFLRSIL